ncbi:uncharacterized protein LY89DRAFT_211628 [Mollisia scopiformis]|uniref:Uncharacterized protein n=1 Tax=Mollisia scopiformis TaxID=149040 RepID=A0A194WY86_MOLSC|nr:uncharacterized protein LY89DRAFT_211628 [Mollisia scopiformis]KUJ12644.1 hypothetical protein LY89DRAFT_211628 [Mollisia scopiformis]
MASRIHLMAVAILGISTSIMANPLARRDPTCPASCIVTTTVTVVSTLTPTTPATAPFTVITETPITSVVVVGPSTGQGSASNPAPPPPASTPLQTLRHCSHNNCLRQFIRHPQVTAFCATYTTAINTATTDLPDFVSQCHAEPTRISSACSCIVGEVSPVGPTLPTGSSGGETQTGGGTFTVTGSGPAPSTTSDNGMCAASIIYETFTQTTTYLVTLTGSSMPSSNATAMESITSSSLLTLDVTGVATAPSSSIAP